MSASLSRAAAQNVIANMLGTTLLCFRGMSLDADDGVKFWVGEVLDYTDSNLYDFCVPCDCPEAAVIELLV